MTVRRKVIACALLIACAASTARGADPNEFVVFSTTQLPGRLYVPVGYDPARSYPLVTFLHGFGARGTNNTSQVGVDIDGLLAECKRREAFLYAPQSPDGNWTGSATNPGTEQTRIQEMLALARQTYSIESERLYLTGYSAGGGGAWDMLARYDGQFAAGVPVAATFGVSAYRPGLVDQPLWAFHARNDEVVHVNTTRNMINRILLARGLPAPQYLPASDPTHSFFDFPPLHYAEPSVGGHGVVHGVYVYPPLYDWMFAQRLPEPSCAVAAAAGALFVLLRRGLRSRSAGHG
jgi:predicted peptidase